MSRCTDSLQRRVTATLRTRSEGEKQSAFECGVAPTSTTFGCICLCICVQRQAQRWQGSKALVRAALMMGSPPSTDTTSSGFFLSAQCETPQGDEGDPSTTLLPTRDQRQTDIRHRPHLLRPEHAASILSAGGQGACASAVWAALTDAAPCRGARVWATHTHTHVRVLRGALHTSEHGSEGHCSPVTRYTRY